MQCVSVEATKYLRIWLKVYTVSQKNDTDVAHCNFNTHQPISLIFGTDIAE